MARLQLPYATAAILNAATPLHRELLFDTTNNRARIGDGTTAGGLELALSTRAGWSDMAEAINVFAPNSTPDGATDNTAAIQAALTAALAVHAAGGRACLYLGPGKWRTTTAFTIDQAYFTIVCDGQIEQLTHPKEIFFIEEVDDCSIYIRKAVNNVLTAAGNTQNALLSQAISDRRFGVVLRASHAPVIGYNCNRTRVNVVESRNFICGAATFIGGKRHQFSYSGGSPTSTTIPLPTTDVDGNSMTGFANDYFNGWLFQSLDSATTAGSDIVAVADYDAATRTLTVPDLTVYTDDKKITSITRSGATATATSAAHGYSNGNVVYIEHAGQSEYNIKATISNVTTNTFDYTVSGTPASPATVESGYNAIQVNLSVTPTGTHRFVLVENAYGSHNSVICDYVENHDYGFLALQQDQYYARINSGPYVSSQGVSPHGIGYGSGERLSIASRNGHMIIRGSAMDGPGEALKVRCKSFDVDISAERCRGAVSLEQADNGHAIVRGLDIGEVDGVSDASGTVKGVATIDCQNCNIEGEIIISSNYNEGVAYGATAGALARTSKNVNYNHLRIVSKANNAAGVRACYAGADTTPQALTEYVTFHEPDIEQVGTGAVTGLYSETCDRVRFLRPRTRGLTGNLYSISSSATNTYIQLNEELLHSGWARSNLGTNTGLSFEPRPQVSWTPVLAGTGGSANTYSTQAGFYRDIGGGLAWVQFRVVLTALNSTGALKITGFPRTFGPTYFGQMLLNSVSNNITSLAAYQLVGKGSSSSTDIALQKRTLTTGAASSLDAADVTATLDLIMNGIVMIGDVVTA